MHQLTSGQVSKYEPKFKELAPATNSRVNRHVNFSILKKKEGVAWIVGCTYIFGFKKYYIISSQNDIDNLISIDKLGNTMHVEWYYLTDTDANEEDLITL
jgi:hypothetical protein